MADISKITLPSGSTYDIKDSEARKMIDALNGYTTYLGVTTTVLTDGIKTNPIKIGTEDITATKGCIVNYGKGEFIFNGSEWQEFGDLSGLGTLAFKNSASGTVNISGSVSKPTFTGTEGTVSVSGGSGIVSIGNGTANYTPSGSVTNGKITMTPSTTSVVGIDSVGSLPSCTLPSMTATVANETLTFGWNAGSFSAGSLPSKATAKTVLTDVSASQETSTFSGTGVELKVGQVSASGKFTPNGSVSQPKFTGNSSSITVS